MRHVPLVHPVLSCDCDFDFARRPAPAGGRSKRRGVRYAGLRGGVPRGREQARVPDQGRPEAGRVGGERGRDWATAILGLPRQARGGRWPAKCRGRTRHAHRATDCGAVVDQHSAPRVPSTLCICATGPAARARTTSLMFGPGRPGSEGSPRQGGKEAREGQHRKDRYPSLGRSPTLPRAVSTELRGDLPVSNPSRPR